MDKKKWLAGAACCCAVWVMASCSLLPAEEVAPPPIMPAEDVEYDTVEAERGFIAKTVNKTGSLISPIQYDLSFEKRGGYVTELVVRSGAQVKKGDIMAAIDTEELEQQVAEQQVAVRIAQINYNEALETALQDTAQPAVQRARANLDLAWLKLNNLNEEFEASVIRAPIDGRVTYAAALKVGDFAQARTTVFTVSDDTVMVVVVTGTTETDLLDLTLDMEVELAYRKEFYTGVVTVTPANAPKDAFYSTRPYVMIEFEEMPADPIIGQSVQVTFNKEASDNAVIVPINAVTQYGNYAYVRVLEDGVSRERPVELGITTLTQAEITEGLQPGEQVVVR